MHIICLALIKAASFKICLFLNHRNKFFIGVLKLNFFNKQTYKAVKEGHDFSGIE